MQARVECTKLKSRIQIYGVHGEVPLFFDIPDKECIIPSIFLLWKFPNLLPKFYTYGAVSQKLISGADLMLPGIIIPVYIYIILMLILIIERRIVWIKKW